jgi:hypothetical protein
MLWPVPPLESRTLSSGLARRTLRNLDFIINASHKAHVHPVTQVVNSLLGLLVFPVEREQSFLAMFSHVQFNDASNLADVRDTVIQHLGLSSLRVVKFGRCEDLGKFLKRLRNAIAHKYLEFSGDPDSRVLADVTITLKDRKGASAPFDWEIALTAQDLERLIRCVGKRIIDEGL